MKSLTTNVETSINEEVFHEVSESFQRESSSSLLNNDMQQSPEEADLAEAKPMVSWHKLVWFSQNIPRYAFMVWLAFNHRLKTLDRIVVWQENVDTKCSLCELGSESHNHLFFECRYSLEVWQEFKDVVRLDFAPNTLSDIIIYLSGRPINRSIWSVLQRLVIGFMAYFIWHERNLQKFQDKCRPVRDLCGIIRDNVRLRLISLKIKKSMQVMELARLWDFGVEECNGGKTYSFV
nr:RNA-directed DNA polymerase, eukaryota, reverse transcriptase zinc-binding domain protein [Tanacetum cinerariifolium]